MQKLQDGTIVERALFQPNEHTKGWFDRGYNQDRQEYLMINSYFDPDLPRWIKNVRIPLVEGKGIPTALYLDLYLMKKLNVRPNLLKTIRICNVHDWESIFHLSRLSRDHDENTDMGELFKQTRLFRSRNNVIVQTGLKISEIKIDASGAQFNHPKHLVQTDDYRTGELIAGLCQKYAINNQDMVFWNFDVVISVERASRR